MHEMSRWFLALFVVRSRSGPLCLCSWSVLECCVDESVCLIKLLTRKRHSRRADACVAPTDAFLNKFDELDEFWHSVQPQQWKEPRIKFLRSRVTIHRVVKEINGL